MFVLAVGNMASIKQNDAAAGRGEASAAPLHRSSDWVGRLERHFAKIVRSSCLAPLCHDVLRGLVEVDVLVDPVDPVHRDEMMLAIWRGALGELDLVLALEVID